MLQLVHREVVEQAGEDCSVSVGERGLADLALKDEQLVTEGKDFNVFVPVVHRQQTQEREGVGGRDPSAVPSLFRLKMLRDRCALSLDGRVCAAAVATRLTPRKPARAVGGRKVLP
ncbi:hypothetical protein ABT317_41810 [Streptomyces carpinensis]|uniref:Uncharacterized protein n=1 Tax=Streptomyces carpinensis TaxID=66369 RepID=A0ABV1WGL8_9ACTN